MRIEDLDTIDYLAPEYQGGIESAVAAIAKYQDVGYVMSQRGLELVNYETAFKLANDARFNVGMAGRLDSMGIHSGVIREIVLNSLFARDGESHVRARRAAAPFFSAASADKLRGTTRQWIQEWLDEYEDAGESFDFLNLISNELPARLFCLLIGAPLENGKLVRHLSEEAMLLAAPPMPGYGTRIEAAAEQIREFIAEQAAIRRQSPGDDLLSALVAAEERGDLIEGDILAILYNALVGSTDTTSSQICLDLQALSEHDDQWELLRDEPDLVPNAIVELMRFNPGSWSFNRSPMETLEFEGMVFTPEDSIYPCSFAANSDPRVFENPRALDIKRPIQRQPLNFGAGRHSCLGRMISVMEQEEVVRAVRQKWERFRVVDAEFTGAMFALAPLRFVIDFEVAEPRAA